MNRKHESRKPAPQDDPSPAPQADPSSASRDDPSPAPRDDPSPAPQEDSSTAPQEPVPLKSGIKSTYFHILSSKFFSCESDDIL